MTDTETIDIGRTCTVLVPAEVEPGATVDLRVEVEAPPAVLETDQNLEIRDAGGSVISVAALGRQNGESDSAVAVTELSVVAPESPGPHTFVAWLAPLALSGAELPTIEVSFSLQVADHRVAVAVFDLPQAVEPGARFTAKIGAGCGARCHSTGWTVTIRDADGKPCATGTIGDDIWPGTEGLHFAEIELVAPDTIGLAAWDVTVEATGDGPPHETGSRRFSLRTSPPADARLKVEAFDAETGDPVPGLKVVAGPFRTVTGADGTAVLAVSRGTHRVFVSGGKYIPYRADCLVENEATLRASLQPDVGLTEQMVWG